MTDDRPSATDSCGKPTTEPPMSTHDAQKSLTDDDFRRQEQTAIDRISAATGIAPGNVLPSLA